MIHLKVNSQTDYLYKKYIADTWITLKKSNFPWGFNI